MTVIRNFPYKSLPNYSELLPPFFFFQTFIHSLTQNNTLPKNSRAQGLNFKHQKVFLSTVKKKTFNFFFHQKTNKIFCCKTIKNSWCKKSESRKARQKNKYLIEFAVINEVKDYGDEIEAFKNFAFVVRMNKL